VPLIHGPDGAKMSKRHGALGVDAYRDMGYLPAAMRNYLVRLGWSHGDDETMTTAQMIEWFGLDALGKSPARFDFNKLENLNGHYIRHADDAALIKAVRDLLPHLPEDKRPPRELGDADWSRFEQAMPGLKERAKTLLELIDGARFLFAERPLDFDEKAKKVLSTDARARLAALHEKLSGVENWSVGDTEKSVRELAGELGVKLGDLAQPLRAALTGRAVSPPIFDVLAVLGREESLARIKDQAA
jgi:glutamyl-tRNA synthetase